MNERAHQNTPETQIEKDILSSENFNQLYSTLQKLGGLQGSIAFYPAAQLQALIEEVRKGAKNTDHITRTGGLRMQVIRLVAADSLSTKTAVLQEEKFKDTTIPPGTVLN